MTIHPTETAIVDAATRVLQRRATALRERAANGTSTVEKDGRIGIVVSPEARVALGTAALFEQIVVDISAPPPAAPCSAGRPSPKSPAPTTGAIEARQQTADIGTHP